MKLCTDQSAVDKAGRAANRTVEAVLDTVEMLLRDDVPAAKTAALVANEAAQNAFLLLVAAGANVPAAPAAREVPLHLLDTPETRRLLDLLRQAQAAAEAVDAQRGNVLSDDIPLGAGESRGTGWAEEVSFLVERLRIEVEGPRDALQGHAGPWPGRE